MSSGLNGAIAKTLENTTPVVFSLFDNSCTAPITATLKSSYASRLVEFSTDGGVEYFTPSYDYTSATMIVVSSVVPITHIRFTGQANDYYLVKGA